MLTSYQLVNKTHPTTAVQKYILYYYTFEMEQDDCLIAEIFELKYMYSIYTCMSGALSQGLLAILASMHHSTVHFEGETIAMFGGGPLINDQQHACGKIQFLISHFLHWKEWH